MAVDDLLELVVRADLYQALEFRNDVSSWTSSVRLVVDGDDDLFHTFVVGLLNVVVDICWRDSRFLSFHKAPSVPRERPLLNGGSVLCAKNFEDRRC